MEYTDIVKDHFSNPRNLGKLNESDGVGEFQSHHCGDMTQIFLKIEEDTIVDIGFKTFGCAAAIASSSMVTEMIKGKTIKEALKITNKEVVDALGGLPEAKIHCSVMAKQAVRSAVEDYLKKHNRSLEEIK